MVPAPSNPASPPLSERPTPTAPPVSPIPDGPAVAPAASAGAWTPWSWQSAPTGTEPIPAYPDPEATARVARRLAAMPPLVTSFEVEHLKAQIADAQAGRRFLLWGGDCAEALADCTPDVITSKLKILLQMSLVLVYAGKRPVVRIGRIAGQYAKPRSSPTETRLIDGRPVTLPSFHGDIINRAEFTPEARRPDPELMIEGYTHAALTLNFVRSLLQAGFADVQHPEYWDLGFLSRAGLTPELREQYQRLTQRLADGVEFMQAIGERSIDDLHRVELFTSHEALNLHYEAAQTRTVPRREGYYNLSTHLPWIGERTRRLDGPHITYAAGIRNPVGLKVGPRVEPDELLRLIDRLNPANEPGKLVLIPRLGAFQVAERLPPLLRAVRREGRTVAWVCDPMHANATLTRTGIKTRSFDDILRELLLSWDLHAAEGSHLDGVHIELTGQDVTECTGGAAGIGEDDLSRNYGSPCDPRLNYEQALELAFSLAQRMQQAAGRR